MAIAAYSRICAKNVSGNLKFWIAEIANITSITVTSGEISAVSATAYFKRTQATLEKLGRTEKVEGGKNGYKYTHEVTASFAKPSKNLKTFLDSLDAASPCGMAVIMLDANGQAWLIGYNQTDLKDRGMALISSTLDSGMAPGEDGKQQVDIVMQCLSTERALPFDATQNALIIAETATYLSTT